MMISALKIRLSGSAFRDWGCLTAVALTIALAVGCSHAPVKALSKGERDNGAGGKGSIQFWVKAPEANNVVLVLMRTHSAVPVTWEVHARKRTDGTWAADFDLIPGEYRYFFMVDGSITVGKGRGRVEMDDFGGKTGVLNVFQGPDGGLKAF